MAYQRPPWIGPNSLIPDAEEPPRPPTPPGYIPRAPTPPPPPPSSSKKKAVQAIAESDSESESETEVVKKPKKKSKKAKKRGNKDDQAVALPASHSSNVVPPPPPAGSVRSDGAQVQNSRYTSSSEMREGGIQYKQGYYYTMTGEKGHNSGSMSWFEANQGRQ